MEQAILEILNNKGIRFWRFRQHNPDISLEDALYIFSQPRYVYFRTIKTIEEWNSLDRKVKYQERALKLGEGKNTKYYFDFSQTHGRYCSFYNYPTSDYIIGAIDQLNGEKSNVAFQNYDTDLEKVITTYLNQKSSKVNESTVKTVKNAILNIVGQSDVTFDEFSNEDLVIADKIVTQLYQEIKEREVKGYDYKRTLRTRGRSDSTRDKSNGESRENENRTRERSDFGQVGNASIRNDGRGQQGTVYETKTRDEVSAVYTRPERNVLAGIQEDERENVAKSDGRLFDGLAEQRGNGEDDRRNTAERYNNTSSNGGQVINDVATEKAGTTYYDEQKNTKEKTVAEWYKETYPTDELGLEINQTLTFEELSHLDKDIYEAIGVGDSVVKERVLQEYANINKITYDEAYDLLVNKQMQDEQYEEDEQETNVEVSEVIEKGKEVLSPGENARKDLSYDEAVELASERAKADGIPYVVIEFSESNDLKRNEVYSFDEINEILYELDKNYNDIGYDKTYVEIYVPINDDVTQYNARYEIGVEKVDLYDHIKEWYDSDYEKQGETEYIKSFRTLLDVLKASITPTTAITDNLTVSAVEPIAEPQEEQTEESKTVATNYKITEELEYGGLKTKFRNNVEAIRLVKKLLEEDRDATKEEQDVLVKYTGWGGLPQPFDKYNYEWEKEYEELKELLTSEEYTNAKGSTLNAHYTSNTIIKYIYKAMEGFGVKNCNMLEPALGIGNFIGALPDTFKKEQVYGVEIDSISGAIASKLYPESNVQIKGFEETSFANNTFDTVITNVPFGQYKVYDKDYQKENFYIHDYFIAKSIDKVRPKGICAFITSKGTLDKTNIKARQWIADKAEFLGAIRLPNNAFSSIANTKVTTDILFFQKRELPLINSVEEWVYTTKLPEYEINNYFLTHPEMMLGRMAKQSTMYGNENETTLLPYPDKTLEEQLEKAIAKLPKNIYQEKSNIVNYEEEENTLNRKNGTYFINDYDEVCLVEKNKVRLAEFKGKKLERAKGMITLKEQVLKIIDLMLVECSDEVLKEEQSILNEKYDNFIKKYGYINNSENISLLEQDAEIIMLSTIEDYDTFSKTATKGKIFSERTIKPHKAITHTDDVVEALAICLNEKGVLDIKEIETLTNKSFEEVVNELDGKIYLNPLRYNKDDKYEGWETAEEYLSGNVKQKLRIAEIESRSDKRFTKNVEDLTKIQPKPIPAEDIAVRIGTNWIDKKYYEQFFREVMDMPHYASLDIEYNEFDTSWSVKCNRWSINAVKLENEYGTVSRNAIEIFEDSLNQKASKVTMEVRREDDPTKTKRVIDKERTAEARAKQKILEEKFESWIFEDEKRRNELVQKYNDIYNNIVLAQYDGSYLDFPNMNVDVKLYPHQQNAVHRIITTGNTLLHHCVGAGKTYTVSAAAMKLRQLGLANKPLIVVPNHLTKQWAQEFLKIYPTANVLLTTNKDMEKKNRLAFVSKIATGDWDAIIMPYSFFTAIPISPQRQQIKINDELEILENLLDDAKNVYGNRQTIKNIEKQKKALETRLRNLMEKPKKDDLLTFEQLGVDYLFIDEAHYFKNKLVPTKIGNVRGINNAVSQRATDMDLKCEYINELHGGQKGVLFATGTPISNSMSEMFIMQQYLSRDLLKEKNIEHFDNWIANFGRIQTSYELSVSGKSLKPVTRLSKFVNLPELTTLYKTFADVQTAEMLNLPVPTVERITVECTPTLAQQTNTDEIIERGLKISTSQVKPQDDNMLKLTGDGKKNSLDARLYNPLAKDEPESKINRCADIIYKKYIETTDIKGTQMVFCDLSTPKKPYSQYKQGIDFDVYNELKTILVQKGIPQEQIKFIHEAGNSNNKKQEIFDQVKNGNVRILLGSTQKCGTGANIQKHLVALHHLDAPYRPADLEQRDGRIIRQGNENEHVEIYTYVTKQTFDSYSYQILENKQRFISQINTNSLVRQADDIDEQTMNFATLKSITTGNPLFMRQLQLQNEVKELEGLERSYKSAKWNLQKKISTLPTDIAENKRKLKNVQNDKILINNNQSSVYEINSKQYDNRKEAGEILTALVQKVSPEEKIIGKINGLSIITTVNSDKIVLAGNGAYSVELGNDGVGNMLRIENKINGLDEIEKNITSKVERLEKEYQTALIQVEKPFAQEEEYRAKKEELSKIEAELSVNKDEELILDDSGVSVNVDDYVVIEQDDELEDETTKPKVPKIEISQEMLNLISNMPTKKQDVQLSAKNEYISD